MLHRIVLLAGLLGAPAGLAAQEGWVRAAPLEARQPGVFQRPGLDESSGIAASRRSPGVLWTVEDSENDPILMATDTLGRDLGAWTVTGARNRDWESVRLGPCGSATCVYIADTGDNGAQRRSVTIYRVREPDVGRVRSPDARVAAEALSLRYPDGPADVEAFLVTPAGDILLITKVRSGASMLYEVPASAWRRKGVVLARRIGPLALPARGESLDRATDAALAPDGRRVLILTYAGVFFFELRGNRLEPGRPPMACGILGLQPLAEGADWLAGDEIIISGESAFGVRGGVSIVKCPARGS